MTTSIITDLLGPMCELFYKYKRSLDIQSANINTVRNYGFNTSYSLNFGFELNNPFDFNNILLQPGVFTYQSNYNVFKTPLPVSNFISLQELPPSGFGTINYQNKTLPIKISIQQDNSSVIGIASNYITSGIPYDSNIKLNEGIIRQFESDFVTDSNISILIFVNIENATFTGLNTNWTSQETSLYTYETISYRYNNGFGQFYSESANSSFIPSNLSINYDQFNFLYKVTYANVYNWANLLDWSNFLLWFDSNKSTLNKFLVQFLSDYFLVN